MNHHYRDITDKLGEPKWWDEHAVPRYCDFTPDESADIYANEVVLLHIECQSCRTPFRVCMSASAPRINWYETKEGGPTVVYPDLADSIDELHYGDPPNAGCCPAGPTMNSVLVRVIEFWERSRDPWGWKRRDDLERDIACDWAEDLRLLLPHETDRVSADSGLQGPWTIDICPICGGQARQLAHGRCARECRDAHGVIPPMIPIQVVRAETPA